MKERHRVFIAINLPEKIKKELIDFSQKWPDLPVRWAKKESLHLTLAFLGYLSDEDLVKICQAIEEISLKHSAFFLNFNKIDYGPKDKGVPRLIWLEGQKSEKLSLLKKDLDKILMQTIGFLPENRDFMPHITLARIKKWDWQKIEPEEKPEIAEDFFMDFEVRSIEAMESRLKKSGAEYTTLQSYNLK